MDGQDPRQMPDEKPDKKFEEYFPDPESEEGISDLDFDALMATSLAGVSKPRDEDQIEPGTRVEGVVVSVSDRDVVFEISSKTTAVAERDEFGLTVPAVGDRVAGEVVRYDPERAALVVKTKEIQSQVFWESLRVGTRYSGNVTAVNKGGLELSVGNERAFMPISQIERHRVTNMTPYLGQTLEFEVTQFDAERRNLVVSRRVLLDEEYEAACRDALGRFREGQVVSGSVVRINQHGAFVDVGGFEGLLHASRIARARKDDAPELREGDTIQVEIMSIDLEQSRMGLEWHRTPEDSWDEAASDFQAGESATGVISRVTDEGAYVWIDDGVEGLLPLVELERHGITATPGGVVATEIASVDLGARRILLRVV